MAEACLLPRLGGDSEPSGAVRTWWRRSGPGGRRVLVETRSPDIVRWYGAQRITGFLRELVGLIKQVEPSALVGYANFPSTEYLETDFTDFLAFNVYLHSEPEFRKYLSRLHTLAGDRPLVLTEFGIDSIREGEVVQASTLSVQVRAAIEMGAAGTVSSRSPTSGTPGAAISQLGLRPRQPRAAQEAGLQAVQRWYATPGLPALAEYPKVSVVICAYNADHHGGLSRILCATSATPLRGLVVDRRLQGPHRRHADSFEGIHVIHQRTRAQRRAQCRHRGVAR